jgi:hypothetical protein
VMEVKQDKLQFTTKNYIVCVCVCHKLLSAGAAGGGGGGDDVI